MAKVGAHPPRITYAPTLLALDLWHGNVGNRQYSSRKDHFTGVADVGDLVRLDKQGIYEFRKTKAAKFMNNTICKYFQERVDDSLT